MRRNRVNDVEINNFNLYKNKWNIKSESIIKPGLDSIYNALEKLGNPQNKQEIIHVAGTNGKGSTIAFMKAIANAHSLSYGAFTSPSIIDVHDQIQLNGVNVKSEQMDMAFEKMQRANLSGMLTDFELLTVAAFLVFETETLDIVFIEAGMGGRFDSTNVFQKSLAVIPSISIDHTNFLGDTIEKISWHKAGILKEDSKLIIGQLEPKAKTVFLQEVLEKNGAIIEYGNDFIVHNNSYSYDKTVINGLHPRMLGNHQKSNMAIAITALLESSFPLDESKVQLAVKNARLQGRMERVEENLYFDGAHNKASIDSLVETVKSNFPHKNIHFIVGILKDKDYIYMLRKLEEIGSSFEFVQFNHERALPPSELYKHCLHDDKRITKDMEELLFKNMKNNDVTIVTGSLYLISELKLKTGK